MSLFGEFQVPVDTFALQETLTAVPDARIEVERVVATESVLTPYFWVSVADLEAFEAAVDADPSVRQLQQLDAFEESALYRAEWTVNVAPIIYAITQVDGVVLEAVGTADGWRFQMRFDGHDQLRAFRQYCTAGGVDFELLRLHELSQPLNSEQYNLTDRQSTALRTAWKLGYFEDPRRSTLAEVAAELDITQQSLSDLLRRGHSALIESTLMISEPTDY